MNVPEDKRREAAKAQELVRTKLLEIMDLQADIDTLLRDNHPTPFGSAKWKNGRPEELQRLVLMTAVQFILFEPMDWVPKNDEFKTFAEELMKILSSQMKWLKIKYAQR